MQLRPKISKFRSLSKTLAQRGGVIPPVYVIIILNGQPDGAEAFDFGAAKKRRFHVAVGETKLIPGIVNKMSFTLEL
jgi:hypothetical protein